MDIRLEKALEVSNFMKTLANQRRILKQQFEESLVYFYDGCQFTISIELINYVSMLISRDITEDFLFIDDNDIPVKVSDLNQFLDEIQDQYFQALNRYYTEYNKIKSNRSVEKLVEYEI